MRRFFSRASEGAQHQQQSPLPTSRVVVLGRQGCHLCEVAHDVVAQVCDDAGIEWSLLDIDDNSELRAAYSDFVPVILIDGEVHTYWRVDEPALRAALA